MVDETGPGALWAPWRMAYLGGPRPDGCPFCTEPGRVDREGLVLLRGAHAYVVLNRYPYAAGHVLVVPFRHEGDPLELSAQERAEMDALELRCLEALGEAIAPHGFNVGMNVGAAAGQGVAGHLHVHVVPRFHSDTNFMPVLGGTRVLPELLEETWDRLRPHFERARARDVG